MKRLLSAVLASTLLVSLAPMAFAAQPGDNGYVVTDRQSSVLALGVAQDIYTVKMNSDKEQNKFFLATVELGEHVEIHANVNKNEFNGKWDLVKTTEQMQAAQERRSNPANTDVYKENFNIVAGVNAGYYNMSTSEPLDALVMDGNVHHGCGGRPFFAILKDGTPVIGSGSEWDYYMDPTHGGPIQEAVGGSYVILRDGEIQDLHEPNNDYVMGSNARAFIGIKADGKTVVMGEVDGLKRPKSRGMNLSELAQVLVDQGCVIGLNLDGGGSSTYVSKQEDGTFKMLSDPADGYERAVSTTLYVASTTPPSDDFASVTLTPEHEYVTPGTVVPIKAQGYSSAHTPVAIPEDAVMRLAEASANLGAVKDGSFVSNGTAGDAAVEVVHSGKVVGSTVIHVVTPDTLSFEKASYSLPYGERIDLKVTASYDNRIVACLEDDIQLELSDSALGTTNGLSFTACQEGGPSSGTLTARFRDTEVTAATVLTLGKGSKLIYDFEDADTGGTGKLTISPIDERWNHKTSAAVVTADTGRVHSGKQSLAITLDCTHLSDNYTASGGWNFDYTVWGLDIGKDAKKIGMWVWIPDEDVSTAVRLGSGSFQHNRDCTHEEGHWYYVSQTLDSSSSSIGFRIFFFGTQGEGTLIKSMNNKLTFYIDDIWVDYSDVTPDREFPVFGDVTEEGSGQSLAHGSIPTFGADSSVVFCTNVSDNVGVDAYEAYIDGVEVTASHKNGTITTEQLKLASGVHTLKFYAADAAGNKSHVIRQFRIDEAAKDAPATVRLTAHDPTLKNIPIRSVWPVDLVATDVSKIDGVSVDLDLNNMNFWLLKHSTVDPKFRIDTKLNEAENIATITLTRIKPWESGDGTVLVSIPITTWGDGYPLQYVDYRTNQKATLTAEDAWREGFFNPFDVTVDVDRGEITYADGYTPGVLPLFGAQRLQVDTELNENPSALKAKRPNDTCWHLHSAVQNAADLAPTCTANGYTGRMECPVCRSPVSDADWGTVLPALGHDYQVAADGLLKCTRENAGEVCGTLFTGVYSDGKTYKDGKVVGGENGEWRGESFYIEGKKVTGVKLIDGKYYNFGENGVCKGKTPYTGFFDITDPSSMKAVTAEAKSETNKLRDYTYSLTGLQDSHSYSYVVAGESPAAESSGGWFTLKDALRFHIDPKSGKLHRSVHAVDGRECAKTGRWSYTCEDCQSTDQSEVLFFEGHDWDKNHVCKLCNFKGINLEEEGVLNLGQYFKYIGGEIQPHFSLICRGKTLNIRYDAYGYDGGALLSNNSDIGVATLEIDGRGDYYGHIEGQFTIVPESIDENITATARSHTDVQLSWPAMAGAEYYSVYRQTGTAEEDEWEWVTNTSSTSYTITGLEVGEHYSYRVGSRAIRDNVVYYCVRWGYAAGVADHSWIVDEEQSKEASCTEPGYTVRHCEFPGCDAHEAFDVQALGHNVEQWSVKTPATTTAPGEETGVCARCGAAQSRAIPKLPSASTGSSGTTAPGGKQETITNPDGTITTTTTKPDGSKTETTIKADGTTIEKNTDKNGIVTETTSQADGTIIEKVTQTDGTSTQRTTTAQGVTSQVDTDAGGNIRSASVVIPAAGETQEIVTAPLKISAVKDAAKAPEIRVKAASGTQTKVEIPVVGSGPGTVAVMVKPDGTEEIIRECTVGENGVVLGVQGDVTIKIVDKSKTFVDVQAAGHWASDAVEFAAARELFQGTSSNRFTPDSGMTRGMLVTVLYRLDYEPKASGGNFEDVASDAYYTSAVSWAHSTGVVSGYSSGSFGPEDKITREQLVTILYRYAKGKGLTSGTDSKLDGFADAGTVSDYAADAMGWAVDTGLVNGIDGSRLAPKDGATRAQVAAILMRFCSNIT